MTSINTATSFDKKLAPSIVFGSFSQRVTSTPGTNAQLDSVIPQILELLWSDQQMADAFLKGKKGWQGDIAGELGLSVALIKKTIAAFGEEQLKTEVKSNPAGAAPEIIRPQGTVPSEYRLNNSSFSCNTNSTCGSCGCQTGGCNTAVCQSGGCGTTYCISFMKGPKGTQKLALA